MSLYKLISCFFGGWCLDGYSVSAGGLLPDDNLSKTLALIMLCLLHCSNNPSRRVLHLNCGSTYVYAWQERERTECIIKNNNFMLHSIKNNHSRKKSNQACFLFLQMKNNFYATQQPTLERHKQVLE